MNDSLYLFIWWLFYFVVGVGTMPLSFILLNKFIDGGYGLSKTLGSLLVTYIIFLFAIFKIVPLQRNYMLILLSFYLLFNLFIFLKNKVKIINFVKENFKVLLFQEMLFTGGLIFWSIVRGFHPDINGLEKFMDYGFINSILQSKFLPPADMWFAGGTINYYWFGHLWTAVATKITAIPSGVTYNLMLGTILGLALSSAFTISATLLKQAAPRVKKLAYTAGIISALLLVFAGNFHTPFYILKEGADNYWYPDATRFIGYNPETNDKTIHEFPMYSFVVSDLHAHLLNFPFVLLYLAFLANIALATKADSSYKLLLVCGFILGVMFMTNTWDFANYSLATGFVFLLVNFFRYKFSFNTILNTIKMFLIVLPVAFLFATPFILNFESIAEGVDFVNARTPFWQLAILWGFPAMLTIVFSLLNLINKKLTKADVFVFAILSTAGVLIFLPEVIYVKDIYIASHHRANTMFKLTYQAYVMSYLVSGYIAVRTFTVVKNVSIKSFAAVFYLIVFSSILSYAYFSTKSYYAELKNYKGLSGETWLENQRPHEMNVINWLRKLPGQPTILEAPGDSYTEFNVISAYTGLPTVSGWFVHEWLWRGSSDVPQGRVSDITQIYTSSDIEITRSLLKKYGVNYVLVGNFERQKYPEINEAKFSDLGRMVYSTGVIKVYHLNL